eukprot:TRINITY_DN7596_c0_g1_i1.p1 TRINITY_DN7596_c0_g1~~TRINITY_DN7596_c0_g1_i1.p1  ORF type:complete len:725 (-),score=113.25 TRINITY_DN7596_c0_g1_i1:179-2353(-)
MFQSCPEAVGWLHPAHYRDGVECPSPWLNDARCRPSSKKCRSQALKNVAMRAARGKRLSTTNLTEDGSFSWGIQEAGLKMSANQNLPSFSRDRLSIVVPFGSSKALQIHIPMLLSDIVYAAGPGCSMGSAEHAEDKEEAMLHAVAIVAIGPRPECTWSLDDSGEPDENFPAVEPSLNEIWLLCIGNCDWVGLQRILFELSSFGAVRWDLADVYEMKRHTVGTGGCGQVRLGQAKNRIKRANDLRLDKAAVPQVAMKMLKKGKTKGRTCALIESAIRREISFLASVHGHPNLSTLFGVFCFWQDEAGDDVLFTSESDQSQEQSHQSYDTPQWCIVMDLCMEGDLRDLIDNRGPLSSDDGLEMLLGLFAALEHLHCLRIVHRDVKCENILMSSGRTILADMGIAAYLDDTFRMKEMVGSPGYAPPEVVLNHPYTEKVDIFPAGITFYVAVTDTMPFTGNTLKQVLQRTARCNIPFYHEVFHSMSGGALLLVRSLLDREPDQRPSAKSARDGLLAMVQMRVPDTANHVSRSTSKEPEASRPQRIHEDAAANPGSSHSAAAQMPQAQNNERPEQPSTLDQEPPNVRGQMRLQTSASQTSKKQDVAKDGEQASEEEGKQDEARTCQQTLKKDAGSAGKKDDASKIDPTPPKTPKPQRFFTWAKDRFARSFKRSSEASSSSGVQSRSTSQPQGTRRRPEIDFSMLMNPAPPSQPRPSQPRPSSWRPRRRT